MRFNEPNTLSLYLTKIARLGGYVAQAKNPPPCNMVMWRGSSRLTDITLGVAIGAKLMGIESVAGEICCRKSHEGEPSIEKGSASALYA
ncbi:hypothetical protein ACXHXM_36095